MNATTRERLMGEMCFALNLPKDASSQAIDEAIANVKSDRVRAAFRRFLEMNEAAERADREN